MFGRSFAYETKNPDGRYRGPKNSSVMILSVQLCDACEFAAQWEQSQVHNIDLNTLYRM